MSSTLLGKKIITSWEQQPALNTVSGLSPSARAYAIASLLIETDRRIAVVCADSDSAVRMHQDIKTFLALMGKPELASGFDFFPGWEHSPYRGFNPSIKNRIRRMRALHKIRTGAIRGIVTDVEALMQRCPPVKSLEDRAFTLRAGDAISRGELASKLDLAGYQRNDPAEDPGSYAIRGGLFDIFSSSSRRPLRLDFFDDLLETIRTYDPLTQRSDPDPLRIGGSKTIFMPRGQRLAAQGPADIVNDRQ